MTDEILDLIVGEPVAETEVKQNTGPLGCDPDVPGSCVGLIALLGLGAYLAFFTDIFAVIIDFITGLF